MTKLTLRTGALAIALLVGAVSAHAQNYAVDRAASDALTKYLHRRALPAVGAEISNRDDGSRRLLLYGFVATARGKSDAEAKALEYLNDPKITLVDSIAVNPAIKGLAPAASAPPAQPASSPVPDPSHDWNKVMQGIYRSGEQPPPPGLPPMATPSP